MGEAYKGLTIKIGADSTEFTKALRTANSAIKQTQSELRTIKQGLKFDGSSISLLKAQFDQTEQKAQETRMRLNQMNEALTALKKNPAVMEVAENTKNLALEARIAKERYVAIDTELEKMNKQFESLKVNGKQVFDKNNYKPGLQILKEVGLVTKEDAERFEELKRAHHEALDRKAIVEEAAAFKSLQIEVNKTEAELKDLTSTMSSLKSSTQFGTHISEGLQKARKEMKLTDEVAEELKREFQSLDEAIQLNPSSFNLAKQKAENFADQIKVGRDRIASLQKQINSLKSSNIDHANKSTRELAESAQKAEKEYEEVSQQLQDMTARLYEAQRAASKLEAENGKESDKYRSQVAEIERLEGKLKELIQLEEKAGNALETARAEKELKELETQVESTAASVAHMSTQFTNSSKAANASYSAIKSVGMTMFSTVGPEMVMLGAQAVQAADNIDSAFRSMKKTVNGTAEDFEHLRDAAIEFSQVNAVSADTILNIEAMGGQLGIAVEELESFAYTVSNLDIATNMEADTIAENLGQLASIMDINEEKFSNFGDALVRLGNNMPAQESAIMDITSRIGSMGTIMGMSTPQVLAWATAIASTGQNSEAAGTAISNTMSDIETAVTKGGSSLQGFADIAGMSAEEFKTQWEKDASGTMQAFVEGLKRLDKEGKSVDGALQGLGITAVRQKQALLGLTQTTDVLNESLIMSENAWNGVSDQWGEAGDAAREASQKSEGFSGTLQILKNNAAALGDEVGESLIPAMQLGTEALKVMLDVLEAIPAPIKNIMVPLVGLAGIASGPVLTTVASFGTLKATIQSTAEASKQFNKASETLSDVQRELIKSSSNAADIISGVGNATDNTTNATNKSTDATKKSTDATKKSTKALSGLRANHVLLAASLAATAAALVYGAYKEHQEQLERINDATIGLINAEEEARVALQSTSQEVEDATTAFNDYSEAVDKVIDNSAQMAQSWQDSWTKIYASQEILDSHVAKIEELTAKNKLNETEQKELTRAVEQYNEITGASVEVTDAKTGKISQSTEELKKNTEEWKKNMEAQARESMVRSAIEQRISAESELKNLKQQQLDLIEQINAAADRGDWGTVNLLGGKLKTVEADIKDVTSTINALDGAIDEHTSAINETDETLTAFLNTNSKWRDSLNENSIRASEFAEVMTALGISQEELAGKTETEIKAITGAYANIAKCTDNVSGVIAALSELGFTEEELAKLSPTQVQEIVDAYNQGETELKFTTNRIRTDMRQNLTKGAEEGVSGASNALYAGKSDIWDAGTVLKNALVQSTYCDSTVLGTRFTTGYAKGIKSDAAVSSVRSAASYIAQIAYMATEKSQSSSSPSKKAIKLGKYFSQGYAIGIQAEAEKAAQASKALVEGSLAAANGYSLNASVINQANMTSSAANQAALAAQATTISNQRTVNQNTTYNFGDITIDAHDLEGIDYIEQFVSLVEQANLATGGR